MQTNLYKMAEQMSTYDSKTLKKIIYHMISNDNINAFYPLSHMKNSDDKWEDDIQIDGDNFKFILFDDEFGHEFDTNGQYEDSREYITNELEKWFEKRKFKIVVESKIFTDNFIWNGKTYNLNDIKIKYGILIKGKIQEYPAQRGIINLDK